MWNMQMPRLVPLTVIQELPREFARVQKKRKTIKYAPTVAQARRDVTTLVLMELLFVNENLILEIPKLVPEIVIQEIDYRVCPRSEEKNNQICTNCCAGTMGCNYFSADGSFVCKGESDLRNPKDCPRNCDPRIDYRVCRRSEEKNNQICTNCCAGTKGYNYFSADGTFVCKGESDPRNPKACPRNCDPRIDYRFCPRSEEKDNQICTNCCAGTKGCNYFSADGTFVCKGESDPRNPKACPRNCDPRIDYRVCPRSEENNNQKCTNCCAGTKGCNYFSANGTFICEGESEYVRKVDE